MALTVVNLILAVIILVMGIWAYRTKGAGFALYAGLGFGLFAISHLLTLLGMADALNALLIVIRIVGYLLVIAALYLVLKKS
jgi:hypothetical protein